MAKKKKKHIANRTISTQKAGLSHTQYECSYAVAKKVLRHFGFDPSEIDRFSKKQKQILLHSIFDPPIIKPEKENTVPRYYVKNINTKLFHFMKTEYFGNPENQLTYMDLLIYGLGFLFKVQAYVKENTFASIAQEKTLRQLSEKFDPMKIITVDLEDMYHYLHFLLNSYSQVNFRLYGFHYALETCPSKLLLLPCLRLKIQLTVHNCEYKMFNYNKHERKAFRLILSANGLLEPSWAVIMQNEIFSNAKEDKYFNIYIQSHALHRFKERMDIFDPAIRNYQIQYALTRGQHVVSTEKRIFLSCLIGGCPIGYFTFFVHGDDLVISTFIPLASENTPEGKKLQELLPLNKEDITYLGMDKISFYTQVDFEQIPVLKQALIESGIWQSKLAIDSTIDKEALEEGETPISQQKTQFVKTFFDKYELYRTNMLSLHNDDKK